MGKVFSIIIFFLITSSVYAVPSFREVKDSYKKSDAVLLDRHGRVIHELRTDPKGRRLDWIGIEDVSPALKNAVIFSEDRRFYQHSGVDWKAIGSVFVRNLFSEKSTGASTITMQLVSMVEKGLKPKGTKRTLGQKWNQIKAAEELEKTWRKNEILEAYLNLVTFRGELQGLSASARGLFGKEPHGLDEAESLILASLIRSPNAKVEKVIARACVLGEAVHFRVRCEDIRTVAKSKLIDSYTIRQRIALAPHVAYQLLGEGKTSAISTLDGELQRFATEVLKRHLTAVGQQNVHDGALLVVENKTGDILAYVTCNTDSSGVRHADGVRAMRQAGSTLKPFLYALAFEKRILTPASLLLDGPLDVPTGRGIYKPEDYEHAYQGMVTVRTALASSLNIPAVRTLAVLGLEPFIRKLRLLGFDQLRSNDYYGLSLALGSADVSLYELVNAYRTLANNGAWSELRLAHDEKKILRRKAIKEEAAFLVSNILADRGARSTTFSLENPLATKFWAAVKTGTSKDMRDNWCIGYTQKYSVGVWAGNFTGEPMWNVTGVTGAAPVWLEIMNYLHKDGAGRSPESPDGVIAKKVQFEGGMETERTEWFLRGTEPDSVEQRAIGRPPKITYPAEGTIIALDPDIPEEQQRVFFETSAQAGSFLWVLNSRPLGSASDVVSWKPQAGEYTLSLVDAKKNVVDSVDFKVKGN
jgi:penicillin-binding protein 1C